MFAWGKVRLRRTARPSTAVTLGLLAAASFGLLVSGPAIAAPKPDPLPVPKPHPKPPPPPPRQPAPPPPPTFSPPPPPEFVSPQPSAAEVAAAASRKAAALASQRRAARLAASRRRAAKLAAKRRAAARANLARLKKAKVNAAKTTQQNPREPVAKLWPEASASSLSRGPVIPFVAGLGALALLLLLIALIPARVAPWYWAERMLVARQQQFALTGVIGLFSVAVSFAVVFLTG
jgi:type IV secretory pathway VirB10-like protein